jgi:DNA end-binding protein Ku
MSARYGQRRGYLMLVTLRYAEGIVSAEDLPTPSGRPIEAKELAMAKQLVSLLDGEFDATAFKDDYRQRVLDFIEQKAKGHKPRLQSVKSKRETSTLDKALAKSIASLKKRKEKVAA